VLAETPLRTYPATPDAHHSYAGGLLEHTVGVATICHELTQLHPRLRADLLLAAALVHDVGRTRELGPPPAFRPTEEGRLLGHVHLGVRVLEAERAPAELLHAVATHHDVRAARTAEAAALYHANQLDAVAATRPAQ
jgi:3'-5' exoribonuclease